MQRLLTIIILLTLSGCIQKPVMPRETWEYGRFVQEVKNGKVEKVSLTSDRTTAIVKVKQDPDLKEVSLIQDPNLINILSQNEVDLSILPPSDR
ncbi:ATP-dependent metalloprotease FtsH [Calothrix sp. PCC 6303]|nr:ATP-dependent metalloprotease FtsH [Calothrix sp. PCC 6303]